MRKSPVRLIRSVSLLFVARILLALVTLAFAASISVNTTTYQAEIGSTLSVANNLSATDKGFSTATLGQAALGTSCSSPILFAVSAGVANTVITMNDQVYDVQVVSSGSTPQQKFNVTLTLASNPYGPLCIQQLGLPVAGQIIDCKFDVGATLPASPYTFRVTVG